MQFDALLETEPQLRYAKSSTPLEAEPLLRVQDVAAILKVPVSWVYEHTRRRSQNRIPGFRLGKYWRFDEAEVREWLEGQKA
jgi:excisionase family DNA binding protein